MPDHTPLTPEGVRALIARLTIRALAGPAAIAEMLYDAVDALEASLPREDADLDAIEALLAETTDGPWIAEYSGEAGNCVLPPDAESTREAVAQTKLHHASGDARFIAWAREGVPALLARVRTAEASLAYERTQTQAMKDYGDRAVHKLNQARFAARDAEKARTVETAEEWEYRARAAEGHTAGEVRTSPQHAVEAYEEVLDREFFGQPDEAPIVERRHPASSWEPVPPTPETEETD